MSKIKSPKYTQSDIDEWMERLAVRNQECEQLERERDEAIRLLKECAEYALTTHQDQVEEFLKKIK